MKNTKETITEKQKEILHWVYTFLFLDSKQIQKLMQHKTHSLILDWLSDLVKQDYLEREYNEKGGENKKPAIFWLSKKGIKFIKNTGVSNVYLDRLLHAEKTSLLTKDHKLLVADIFLTLRDEIQDFRSQAVLADEKNIMIITPDAYYTYHIQNTVRSYFLEVDRETETKAKMKIKFERYAHYYNTFKWKKVSSDYFPCISVVSLTKERCRQLQTISEKVIKEFAVPILFKFTTVDELLKNGTKENICRVSFEENKLYSLL